jgi:hypothetical protein
VQCQAFLVGCLDPDKHIGKSKGLPHTEDVFVSQEHVASCFQIITLFYALIGDGLGNGQTMFGLDKCDVIDDEDARLTDSLQVFNNCFGCTDAIAPTVKGPFAAKGAVPRTAAGELD